MGIVFNVTIAIEPNFRLTDNRIVVVDVAVFFTIVVVVVVVVIAINIGIVGIVVEQRQVVGAATNTR
jgi:hypothetical protein